MMKYVSIFFAALTMLAVCGCISYSYEGIREPETTGDVAVFADSSRIGRPYTVLGTATVSGNYQDVSRERMIDKLKSEAASCGANAILIVEQQVLPDDVKRSAAPVFMTAFDYDDTSRSWSQIYRDVDQTYGRVEWRRRDGAGAGTVTSYRRIIRAEFLRYSAAGVPAEEGAGTAK